MGASKTTGEGILAIWRMGRETVPDSPIPIGLGRRLYSAGRVSMQALLEATYAAQEFEYPQPNSIMDDDFDEADKLKEAVTKAGIGVVCVRYSNARLDEISRMRKTLRQGYSSIEETTRELAGINPFVAKKSEAARLVHVGGLYIPQPIIKLPDAMVQLGLAQTAKIAHS